MIAFMSIGNLLNTNMVWRGPVPDLPLAPKSLNPPLIQPLFFIHPSYTHSTALVFVPPLAKWCHLPGAVFIIEMLEGVSVAEVIYHHIKQALVCERPTASLFPRLEEIRKIEAFDCLKSLNVFFGIEFRVTQRLF